MPIVGVLKKTSAHAAYSHQRTVVVVADIGRVLAGYTGNLKMVTSPADLLDLRLS